MGLPTGLEPDKDARPRYEPPRIRGRTRSGVPISDDPLSRSFAQLRAFVEYQAGAKGVPSVPADPRDSADQPWVGKSDGSPADSSK